MSIFAPADEVRAVPDHEMLALVREIRGRGMPVALGSLLSCDAVGALALAVGAGR